MRAILCAIAVSIPLMSAQAQELSWQEANKKSAEELEAGHLSEAAQLAQTAFFSYSNGASQYIAEDHAQLLVNADEILFKLDQRHEHVKFLQEAVRQFTNLAGENSELRADLLLRLEGALRSVGSFRKASETFENACEVYERSFGEKDPRALGCRLDWVEIHWKFRQRGGGWALKQIRKINEKNTQGIQDIGIQVRAEYLSAKTTLGSRKYENAIKLYEAFIDHIQKLSPEKTIPKHIYGELLHAYVGVGDESSASRIISHFAVEFDGDHESVGAVLAVEPNFQFKWRDLPVDGEILLAYSINGDGRAVDVEVIELNGPRYIAKEAIKTLKKWRFPPMRKEGRPVIIQGFKKKFGFSARQSN